MVCGSKLIHVGANDPMSLIKRNGVTEIAKSKYLNEPKAKHAYLNGNTK